MQVNVFANSCFPPQGHRMPWPRNVASEDGVCKVFRFLLCFMVRSWSENLCRLLKGAAAAGGSFHVCDSEQDKNLDYKLVHTKLTWPMWNTVPNWGGRLCTSRGPRICCVLIPGHPNTTGWLACFTCKLGVSIYNVRKFHRRADLIFHYFERSHFEKEKNVLTDLGR